MLDVLQEQEQQRVVFNTAKTDRFVATRSKQKQALSHDGIHFVLCSPVDLPFLGGDVCVFIIVNMRRVC